jgi:hypothetical protein
MPCCAVLCCAVLCCAVCRRECEKYALACANPDYGNLCFASNEESEAIETVSSRKSQHKRDIITFGRPLQSSMGYWIMVPGLEAVLLHFHVIHHAYCLGACGLQEGLLAVC